MVVRDGNDYTAYGLDVVAGDGAVKQGDVVEWTIATGAGYAQHPFHMRAAAPTGPRLAPRNPAQAHEPLPDRGPLARRGSGPASRRSSTRVEAAS